MIPENLTILIVEDEIISSEYLLDILKSLHFKDIYTATNMNSALEIVKQNKVDIVFMDINISGSVDGISCAKILNLQYFLPIIYTTAYKDSETINEAGETNVFGYLIKPFEASEVEASLIVSLKMIKNSTLTNLPTPNIEEEIINLGMHQKYNLLNKTFYVNNLCITLTKTELDVLYVFCKNLNKNVSYDTLKYNVWNHKDISRSTIRDAVSRLKKKTPNLNIENVVNFGYILKI